VSVSDGVRVTVGAAVLVGRGVGVRVEVGVMDGVKLAVGWMNSVGCGVSVGVTMMTMLVGSGAKGSHAANANAATMNPHSKYGKHNRDGIGDLGFQKVGLL
jgi:hypothetical protein